LNFSSLNLKPEMFQV